MIPPRIQYAIEQKCLYLKLEGQFRCSSTSALEPFVSAVFKDTAVETAVIDLVHALFLDSTTLGILASIAIKLRARSPQKPLIVTGNEDITVLLASMGFEQYFVLVDETAIGSVPAYCGINLGRQAPAAMSHTALEAHQHLAEMNANNREIFKDVIELLQDDIDE